MEHKWTFNADENSVLNHYLESWRNGGRPKRVEIGGKAWEEIKNLNNSFPGDEKRKKEKKKVVVCYITFMTWFYRILQEIVDWFNHHGRKRASKEKYKFGKRWNRRLVIAKEKPEELKAEIRKYTAAPEGSTDYMSFYQTGLNDLIQTLTLSEVLKAKETAKLWNGRGPPPDIQAK